MVGLESAAEQPQPGLGVDEQAAAQGDEQEERRGEGQGPAVEADIGLSKAGEEERQKGGREGRSVPAPSRGRSCIGRDDTPARGRAPRRPESGTSLFPLSRASDGSAILGQHAPDSPFRAVASLPDFPAQEHEILALWRERRTFARLRAQNAGGPNWSFLDGPITANNPMGVHHAWGRAYKDSTSAIHAMLGQDQRYQNGFDCQGLWVEVDVEHDLGFTSKRDIEAFGIAEFVTPVQATRADLRRAPDRAVDPPRHLDGLERPGRAAPLRDLLAADPAAVTTIEGPNGPVTDTVEMIVGRLGMPETRRLATSRSATRTTTSSGASWPSATGAAGCTRATTRCPGARAAARASARWR